MERFYERRLLGFANRHPSSLQIAKRFLCPGWDKVDASSIQKTNIKYEYSVPSTQNTGIFYTVNSEIRTCSCPVGINGAPCKHQGAVAIKFHISTFNFLLSLTLNDRITYTYIAYDKY